MPRLAACSHLDRHCFVFLGAFECLLHAQVKVVTRHTHFEGLSEVDLDAMILWGDLIPPKKKHVNPHPGLHKFFNCFGLEVGGC